MEILGLNFGQWLLAGLLSAGIVGIYVNEEGVLERLPRARLLLFTVVTVGGGFSFLLILGIVGVLGFGLLPFLILAGIAEGICVFLPNKVS